MVDRNETARAEFQEKLDYRQKSIDDTENLIKANEKMMQRALEDLDYKKRVTEYKLRSGLSLLETKATFQFELKDEYTKFLKEELEASMRRYEEDTLEGLERIQKQQERLKEKLEQLKKGELPDKEEVPHEIG